MTNLAVPIELSSAMKAIPSGHDIIYSTLCKAVKSETVGPGKFKTSSFQTHVLITKFGIAYTIPPELLHSKKDLKKAKRGEMELITELYSPLIGMTDIKPTYFKIFGYKCTPLINKAIESKKEFKLRKGRLLSDIGTRARQLNAEFDLVMRDELQINPEISYEEFKQKYPHLYLDEYEFDRVNKKILKKVRKQSKKSGNQQEIETYSNMIEGIEIITCEGNDILLINASNLKSKKLNMFLPMATTYIMDSNENYQLILLDLTKSWSSTNMESAKVIDDFFKLMGEYAKKIGVLGVSGIQGKTVKLSFKKYKLDGMTFKGKDEALNWILS